MSRKTPSMAGWYHSGTTSFDNPEIARFGADGPEYRDTLVFGHGPFTTFGKAKADLIEMIRGDIGNLRYLLSNAKHVKAPRCK